MTLTELKYIVAVARERHFGRAAEACFVSQPTLSLAIRKLEEELGVRIFERSHGEISLTPVGERVVGQAGLVLEQANTLREIAREGADPASGPLRVGVIHTIGPYLLPRLVRRAIASAPRMPLVLQENYTVKLLELLRQGDIDVAILADPFPDQGLVTQAVYDEPFLVAVPRAHPWVARPAIPARELKSETMLLMGIGHCLRDHVLEVCPEVSRFSQSGSGLQRSFEGSSLETIRHMVASGFGITGLPAMARGDEGPDSLLCCLPFEPPVPSRRVSLAWRKRYPRPAAVAALREAILAAGLAGVTLLPAEEPRAH